MATKIEYTPDGSRVELVSIERVNELEARATALTEAVLYANEWAEIGSIVRVPYDAWKKVVSQAALIQESE